MSTVSLSFSRFVGFYTARLAQIVSSYSPDEVLANALRRISEGEDEGGWHEAFSAQLIALEKKSHAEEIPMLYFLSQLPSSTGRGRLQCLPDS